MVLFPLKVHQSGNETLPIPIRRPERFDPLGFLSLIPRTGPAPDAGERNARDAPHAQVRNSDQIRDQVENWMQAGDFGCAGVDNDIITDAPALDGDDNAVGAAGNDDTSDILEAIIGATVDDDAVSIHEEPPPPVDEVEEEVVRSSQAGSYRDAGFEAWDELGATESSVTLDHESLHGPDTVHFAPEDLKISVFQNALAMWESQAGITRSQHSQLVEVFQLATSLEDVQSTPRRKDTLKAHFEKSLPLCRLHQINVKLDTAQLPSKSRSSEDILAFDLEDTLQKLLSSEHTAKKVYKGMAHFTDGKVRNPWESPWWGESVRTTSGQFHRYPDASPIFPSDFVRWVCKHDGPDKSLCDGENCPGEHLGRVMWSGQDFSSVGATGNPLLFIQRVYDQNSPLVLQSFELSAAMCYSQLAPGASELVIVEDDIVSLTPDYILDHIPDVELDYRFSTKDGHSRTRILTCPYTVRHIWNRGKSSYRPLKYSSPHRAELELRTLGRDYVVTNFASREVISLPFQMFVDAFGLYRNMYRSIMGMYYITQFFDASIRNRRSTVFTATLGPFGADLADVFKVLLPTTELDRGKVLKVRGQSIFVCSFVSAILGDMPSQQKIAGCLGPAANYPCRYCMIHTDEKSNLEFDTVMKGRYHEQVLSARRQIARECKTESAKNKQLSAIGLHGDEELVNVLGTLFPSLDAIRSRPADAAHSEYSGLARVMHRLFFQDKYSILTPKAMESAARMFQHFTLPPGWARLQSPITHLESYNIHEYARGVIVIPVLLSQWLNDSHVKPQLHSFIKARARDYLDLDRQYAPNSINFSVADWVVVAAWTFARSVMIVCGQNQTVSERLNILSSIVAGRKAFQFLCQIQADAIEMQSSAKSANRASALQRVSARNARNATTLGVPEYASTIFDQLPSEPGFSQPSLMPPPSVVTDASIRRRKADASEKKNEFLRWKQLPNVHGGLHLAEVAREYGICSMVFVLLGEDKHRQYKADIAGTNHRDVTATLTRIENIRRTLSFLFAGSFAHDQPYLHQVYQQIKSKCPNLAKAIDPHLGSEDEKYGGEESYLEVEGDRHHKHPRAIHGIPRNVVFRNPDSFLNNCDLRSSVTDADFLRKLCDASERDYGDYMTNPGRRPLQWSQKISFTDDLKKRLCFTIGDFAKFSIKGEPNLSVARIDGIFAHQQSVTNRVYMVLTFASVRSGPDGQHRILKCPYYELSDRRAIVGLPRIQPERLWIVDMGDKGLIHVNFDVYFM